MHTGFYGWLRKVGQELEYLAGAMLADLESPH
jgi:hypothetical protein